MARGIRECEEGALRVMTVPQLKVRKTIPVYVQEGQYRVQSVLNE